MIGLEGNFYAGISPLCWRVERDNPSPFVILVSSLPLVNVALYGTAFAPSTVNLVGFLDSSERRENVLFQLTNIVLRLDECRNHTRFSVE
jgi:hypothetical protein